MQTFNHHQRKVVQMNRFPYVIISVVLAILAGCGGTSKVGPKHDAPKPLQTAPPCRLDPQHGTMGACAPKPPPGLKLGPALGAGPNPRFVDLSNNDPVYGVGAYQAMRARGYSGADFKLNQAGYIDQTAAAQIAAARRAGMRVGGYDFADNTRGTGPVTEARIFVGRLRALGICGGRGVIPPTGDFEYGQITPSYVNQWVAVVHRACGRVQIYTGAWYWNVHVGCFWPQGVAGWVSAYASSVQPYLPCGIGQNLLEWQFSDHAYNGANTSDASIYLHGRASWDRYTNLQHSRPPKPRKPRYPHRGLGLGAQGPNVCLVQRKLGLRTRGACGYGQKTARYVSGYQKRHHLRPVTGAVGPRTWASLFR